MKVLVMQVRLQYQMEIHHMVVVMIILEQQKEKVIKVLLI